MCLPVEQIVGHGPLSDTPPRQTSQHCIALPRAFTDIRCAFVAHSDQKENEGGRE